MLKEPLLLSVEQQRKIPRCVSWRGQAEILLATGRIQEAERIKPHIQRLVNMPKPLIYSLDMLSQGSIAKADKLVGHFWVKILTMWRRCGCWRKSLKMNVFDEAEFLLESAVLFEPDNIPLKTDYINVLRKRQKLIEARKHARNYLKATKKIYSLSRVP